MYNFRGSLSRSVVSRVYLGNRVSGGRVPTYLSIYSATQQLSKTYGAQYKTFASADIHSLCYCAAEAYMVVCTRSYQEVHSVYQYNTTQLGMGLVQNCSVYIRYTSCCLKNQAEECKTLTDTSLCCSSAKSTLLAPLTFIKFEKTKHENFNFVHLSFFFSVMHNTEIM